jgi:hypothetical protein
MDRTLIVHESAIGLGLSYPGAQFGAGHAFPAQSIDQLIRCDGRKAQFPQYVGMHGRKGLHQHPKLVVEAIIRAGNLRRFPKFIAGQKVDRINARCARRRRIGVARRFCRQGQTLVPKRIDQLPAATIGSPDHRQPQRLPEQVNGPGLTLQGQWSPGTAGNGLCRQGCATTRTGNDLTDIAIPPARQANSDAIGAVQTAIRALKILGIGRKRHRADQKKTDGQGDRDKTGDASRRAVSMHGGDPINRYFSAYSAQQASDTTMSSL